jgi:hypothetical protein
MAFNVAAIERVQESRGQEGRLAPLLPQPKDSLCKALPHTTKSGYLNSGQEVPPFGGHYPLRNRLDTLAPTRYLSCAHSLS